MNTFHKILFRAKDFLFPSDCALCGGSLTGGNEIRLGLCTHCLDSLLPPEDERCGRCGRPLISAINLCLSCRGGEEKFTERQWALFPYMGKYRQLLTEYKFQKRLSLADFFAEKALEVILSEPQLKDAVIVPVPPRPGKVKENGWDQTDYFVKRLVNLSGGKVNKRRCLKRRKSQIQKKLTRAQRMENLKDRIFLRAAAPKTALIVDDVITTGSTMEVCAGVLKKAGAEKVYGLCLFYD